MTIVSFARDAEDKTEEMRSERYLKQRAMASAAAVASSNSDALAMSIPVKSLTIVW